MHCLWTTIEHWIETVAALRVDIEHVRETLAEIEDTTWGVTLREFDGERVRGWLAEHVHIVTWVWTRTEITGAIEWRTREGLLSRRQRREVLDRLGVVADRWDEVTDVLAVRFRADALLARHPLRTADAGQLVAPLLVQKQLAGALTFVCRDQRLLSAADIEGLRILA